jgi:thioredoxin 1
MEPVIKEIESEFGDKIELVMINVDEQSDLASQYGVMSIPTYVVEKDGQEVGRKVGFTQKAGLVGLING